VNTAIIRMIILIKLIRIKFLAHQRSSVVSLTRRSRTDSEIMRRSSARASREIRTQARNDKIRYWLSRGTQIMRQTELAAPWTGDRRIEDLKLMQDQKWANHNPAKAGGAQIKAEDGQRAPTLVDEG
jgi:hypothetical protein